MADTFEEQLETYEAEKKSLNIKRRHKKRFDEFDEFDDRRAAYYYRRERFGVSDAVQVGSKMVIGGGLGLLAGVATIAVAASAAEIVIGGVITKVTGVVGGAVGLSMGVSSAKRKNQKQQKQQQLAEKREGRGRNIEIG